MQQKELATLLNISPAMVSRLAKRGMPTDTLERAERWRRRHLEPGRVKGARLDHPDSPQHAHGGNFDPAEFEASEPTDEGHHQARTRREIAEANLAELREAEERGKVIRIDAVKLVLGVALAATRERMMSIPDRLATLLAAESAPHRVHEVLSTEIHDALSQLAAAPLRLGSQGASADPQ